ncbi:hypothetical protein JG688_00017133 [Phytophthora aleatoria]|uniref:Uncharacterized protein n=1 Tax=Phytophthora aleatoria TaxID=2496075 RepID=A0A8J5IEE6_9STRA|nr:hypothetical protein JG688_00017133 [Phytophthora aleatoria]
MKARTRTSRDAEWQTALKSKKKNQRHDKTKQEPQTMGKDSRRPVTAMRQQELNRKGSPNASQSRPGTNDRGADQGDGKQAFAQLRNAQDDYTLHTVLRLNDLARKRRFKAYRSMMGDGQLPQELERYFRMQWKDEPSSKPTERYKGLHSY